MKPTPRLYLLLLLAAPLCADFKAGLKAFNAGDYGYALTQFLPDAENGSAPAQNAVGYLYERGLGVSKDAGLAARWYRKSAEQGYGPGEYNYGLLCWRGEGVGQSDADAIQWLQRAAKQGLPLAEFNLGNLYYKDGKGDSGEAQRWWELAAGHKVAAAAYNLAYLYAEGPGAAHDFEKAAKWYRMAAEENYPLAQFALGLLLKRGKGIKPDPIEARMWLELAARGGVKEAQEQMNASPESLSPEQTALAHRRALEWRPLAPAAAAAEDASVSVPDAGPQRVTPLMSRSVSVMRPVMDSGPREYWPKQTGTGFVVNTRGWVVAGYGIVHGCKNVILKTSQDEQRASLVSEDSATGLAIVSADNGIRGAVGLPLAGAPMREERIVQAGFQLREANAVASTAVGAIQWTEQKPHVKLDVSPDPPLVGGPVLNVHGQVVAFSLPGDSGPSLAPAGELRRFLDLNHAPETGNAESSSGDLMSVAGMAKKSIVLVECKP